MTPIFNELLELAAKLDMAVRHAHLGGNGGGVAMFNKQRHLFVDLDAAPEDQLEQTARAIAPLKELESLYLRPDVRAVLEQYVGKD